MKLTAIFLLILTCGVFAPAQSQNQCFQNAGLKDKHIFRFETDGGDVAGSYFIEREYDAEQTETYDFSGTRAGNTLNIKFATYAKLQKQPFEIKSAILTLAKSGGAEILKVRFFGKGKAAVDALDLESCEPSFKALAKTARRVTFAKGATSAKVSVTGNKQAFLINVRQGQFIGVVAFGYSVTIYYPNGDVYAFDENPDDELEVRDQTTNLDFSGSAAAPTSGEALVLLEDAPKGAGAAVFFVKNTEKEMEAAINAAIENR